MIFFSIKMIIQGNKAGAGIRRSMEHSVPVRLKKFHGTQLNQPAVTNGITRGF